MNYPRLALAFNHVRPQMNFRPAPWEALLVFQAGVLLLCLTMLQPLVSVEMRN